MRPLIRRCCSHLRGGSLRPSSPSSPNSFCSPFPVWLIRRNHGGTNASWPSRNANADAIVVGGGAAGIAVVGNLLEAIPRGRIVWIDRSFDGGSIGQLYREIPSYSPAGDFLQYAQALATFRDICDAAPKPNALDALRELDPELTCPLKHAADMLTLISDGLIQHPRVQPVLGTVTHSVRNPKTRHWQTTLTPNHDIGSLPPTSPLAPHHRYSQHQQHTAPLLVYCVGTRPRTTDLPSPVSRLTLDTCLSPTRLARLLPADEPRTIAVVGEGHAAVLVLRNLVGLVQGGVRPLVKKGIRREWKREVPGGGGDQRKDLEGVDYVVQDAGFRRTRLPEVRPGLGVLGEDGAEVGGGDEEGAFGKDAGLGSGAIGAAVPRVLLGNIAGIRPTEAGL
ncbi:predicted protein [Chaetomium globosum CBS 148.51]|uniref:FAD/NAD(P)-binding domain-containing protein n=1 Tax=Chaetomium globosum (strain ATCC 6205 / CBS 148.51 / DSM 1962 / NBRC 6347 / NRRL 1970) TaxID=306901 RepID=Q2H635_CHAGB|nr:uncharacterized protein CHGG_05880 [Chaetomium globosum CBS 148.51]EAQ89261.1 predicted protein [Chaetomium globosum CBS 148.51]